jgi:hypothetical protein
MNEFDNWRERYDIMTIDEQIAYHNDLEARYPEQNHYNYHNVKEALLLCNKPLVLEFGTWKGDLAKQAMQDFNILAWYGIEICEAAIRLTKCKEVNYIKPTKFDWFKDKRTIEADIIVATHFIEHLSNEHFIELAKYCKGVKYIHFESPLTNNGNDWDGYIGTHKLTIGWNKINEIMKENGYSLIIDKPESKTYKFDYLMHS